MSLSALVSSRRSKFTLAGSAVLIAGFGLAAGHAAGDKKGDRAAPAAAVPAASVSVARAMARDVTEWEVASGRAEAVEQVDIRPRVSGVIESIHFHDGQMVKKGAVLFKIDARPFRAEVVRAQAALAGAQVRATLAHTEAERAKRLFSERAIAEREHEQRLSARLEAEANLLAARAALQSANLNLEFSTITAPIDGRSSRAELTVGNIVSAGPGASVLTTLVSASPIHVDFTLDEQTYYRHTRSGTAVGLPVFVGVSGETAFPREGKIKAVDNRIDSKTGTIRVRAVVDNDDGRLTHGMYARVRIGHAARAVLVNDRAIGSDQHKQFVIVVDPQRKAVYREVETGTMVDGLRVIRSGLQAGESIVVNGLQRVRPGDLVAADAVPMDYTIAAATQALASPAVKR